MTTESNSTTPSTIEPLVVNLPQAAMALGVSVDTVRRLVSKGDLPHVRIGNRIRLRRTDVHDYVNNRTTCNWRPGAGE